MTEEWKSRFRDKFSVDFAATVAVALLLAILGFIWNRAAQQGLLPPALARAAGSEAGPCVVFGERLFPTVALERSRFFMSQPDRAIERHEITITNTGSAAARDVAIDVSTPYEIVEMAAIGDVTRRTRDGAYVVLGERPDSLDEPRKEVSLKSPILNPGKSVTLQCFVRRSPAASTLWLDPQISHQAGFGIEGVSKRRGWIVKQPGSFAMGSPEP